MNLGGLIGGLVQQGLAGQGMERLLAGAQSAGGQGGGLQMLMGALASGQGAGGGGAPSAGVAQLLGGAMGGGGAAQGGLGGIVGALTGGGGAGGGLGGVLGALTGGGGATCGGGADLAGMLQSALSGGGAKVAGGGAVAMLAGLALQAFAGGRTPAAPATAASDAAALVDDVAEGLIVRAMLQAAKADGKIDDGEKARLLDRLGDDVDAAERAFVDAEMAKPVDPAALAADVRTPAQGAQIYAASLLAIDVDTQVERDYLAALAGALGLPADVVARVHQATGAPT